MEKKGKHNKNNANHSSEDGTNKSKTAPQSDLGNKFSSTKQETPSQNWQTFCKSETHTNTYRHGYKHAMAPKKKVEYSLEITDVIALDCEMVGAGPKGRENILARVSVVNKYGKVLYDTYVKPINDVPVTDYRTKWSGIRPSDLKKGKDFKEVQQVVANLMNGKIVVGHDLKNDFHVLFLSHPRKKIRDTSKYKPFMEYTKKVKGVKPSLKVLADKILDITIQKGEHDSIEDAKACMAIYMLHQKEWEKSLRTWKLPATSGDVKPHSSKALLMENMDAQEGSSESESDEKTAASKKIRNLRRAISQKRRQKQRARNLRHNQDAKRSKLQN